MKLRLLAIGSCALFSIAYSLPATAQGRFANFETPQTHPIDIATVNGEDYVLVCNTPDNSVEIYRAAPPHAFVQRVPVGMGPATVRWNQALMRFLTCNYDGDSVSAVRLDPVSGGTVNAVLEGTASLTVGDEPSDIAFDPSNSVAAVSLSSRSSVALVTVPALASAGGQVRLALTDPVSTLPLAVKMPRAVAWLPDGRFFATNLRGGSPDPATTLPQYDVGLYRLDPTIPSGLPDFTGGLGSTNHAFAVTSDGLRMFVVGTKAQNHGNIGVQVVSQLVTGFTQSWLMVVDIPPGGAMSVRPEAPPVTVPAPLFQSINLNRDYSISALSEVATDDALVQPTDVLLIETDDGAVARIVLAAFHSDRVAILTPRNTVPGGYIIRRVNIPVLNPASAYSASGPRGVAFSEQHQLVFTNGRLDNTLAVIDPTTATLLTQIQLQQDPTSPEIRRGRQFLYSNRFSIDDSGPVKSGGFVACAACHVDGRTDGLPWDLGHLSLGPPIPPEFHDLNGQTTSTMPNFPDEKGPMVTQTLQGLVNYLLNEQFQASATNAPYHWRGDKADFTDFNEAFVNLQGMDNISTPTDPKGITDAEMIDYRRFINTILHPPNPEQNIFRITPGTLGANPNDPLQATGAKLGMMLFHDHPVVGARSCVDCHHLPDGSTNTSTLTFLVNQTISGGPAQLHPLESAALRNIAQREMLLHPDFTKTVAQFTANNGLLHPGNFLFLNSFSINTFIHDTFGMPGPNPPDVAQQHQALTEFVRQFDSSTAPLAGFAHTVDPTLVPLDSGLNKAVFDALEGQVRDANVGLGVFTRNGGMVKGYWFDITVTPAMYREEGTANLLTRVQVLALAPGTDNVVIAQATPMGTERRWSNPNGVATLISNPSNPPANITLEAMAPNTAYIDVSLFNQNLNLGASPSSSIWTLRTLQQSVVGPAFGVPAVRHEPPRRFRVTGDNVRPGAKLLFAMASGANPASFPIQIMEMELYPTHYTSSGRLIWETNLELDATQNFAMLNGGYWAPDVANVLLRLTTTPSLQPAAWNKFLAAVQNEDQSIGFNLTNWQVLKIQDNR